MKKIYKLKEWYSLDDAAKRLTQTLSEEVTSHEVLELALDGHIQLFWYMRHVSAAMVSFQTVMFPVTFEEGNKIIEREHGIKDADFDIKSIGIQGFFPVEPNGRISYLDGPHKLLLSECGALCDFLRSKITKSGGELVSLDGFYVEDSGANVWNIRERFDDSFFEKSKKNWNEKRMGPYHPYSLHNYFPSGEWPSLTELGFTKNELQSFERKLQSEKTNSVSTRERQTLLKLVIGMAIKKYHFKPELAKNSAPANIANDLEELGIGLDQDTVRKYLNEAKGQLPDFD